MECPGCSREITPDKLFCNWCDAFIPAPASGKKANLGRRFLALVLDSVIGYVVAIIAIAVIAASSSAASSSAAGAVLGPLVAGLIVLAYVVLYFYLMSQGTSPGKRLLSVLVLDKRAGRAAGFWRMLFREVIGKWVSGLILGLGYFWAIWDEDSQSWHDKIAGTVVVKE